MSRGEDVGSQRKEKEDRDNRKKVAERRERGVKGERRSMVICLH